MKRSNFVSLIWMTLLLTIPSCGNSQIICTDVNPDIVNTGNATQDIDVNNDAVADFRLTSAQSGGLSFVIVQGSQIGTNNSVLTNGSGDASALSLNAVIGAGSTVWTQMNGTNQIMITVISGAGSGTWAGATDKYLGLKFIVGTNTFYGWARFTFTTTTNTYIFKDYAFNSVSNQQVLAGQGCGSMSSPTFFLPPTLCSQSSVSVTANTGTATASTYSWTVSPASGTISAPSASASVIGFTGTGIYTVGLAVVSGTTSGNVSYTVQVNPLPTLTLSPVNSTVCTGGTVAISATGSAASFSWGPAAGLSGTTGSMVVASPTVSSIITCTGSLLGCSSQASAAITVLPTNAIYNIALTSNTLCAQPLNGSPNSFTLGVSVASGTNIFSFGISPLPSGINATNSGSMVVIISTIPPYMQNSAAVNMTLQGTNPFCSMNLPFTFSVVANPSITVTPPTPTLCTGKSLTITAAGADTYTWNTVGFGSFALLSNNVAVVNATASAGYSVIGTNTSGCKSDTHQFTVTALSLPPVAASSATTCVNETATLQASGAASYSWTGPGGFSAASSTISIQSTGVYTVTGIAANQCAASTTAGLTYLLCATVNERSGNESSIRVFPNPVSNELTVIVTSKYFIRISDGTGKIVIEEGPFSGENKIILSGLHPGYYFLGVMPEGEPAKFKGLIKN